MRTSSIWQTWTWSIIGTILILSLAASTQGKGKGNGGGGSGSDGDGPSEPLPPIRYRVSIVDLPIQESFFDEYAGLNEVGDLVGYYSKPDGGRGIFLFNVMTAEFTHVDQVVDTSQLPEGYTLGGALDINDHGVIVGYVIDGLGNYRACAIDLSAETPVVDLLPLAVGTQATALKINNAGDILGTEATTGGGYEVCWTFNPGFYGPPSSRLERVGGEALDLRDVNPKIVPTLVANSPESCDLSEPLPGNPAQVAGLNLERIPFRYKIGDSNIESLPEVTQQTRLYFAGISTLGTIAGQSTVVIGQKGKNAITEQVNYRYNPDIDTTYQELQVAGVPQDINNLDEVLLRGINLNAVFRDWNDGQGERAVSLHDLVVGDQADVVRFDENADLWRMNDAGIIVGSIYDDDDSVDTIIILTPETISP